MAWFDDLNLPGSTIDGFFGYVTADGSDEDDNPDVMLASGTVTFTATTAAARVNGAWLGIQSVTAQIFEGRLVVSEEELLPIRLLATDADIGVEDWAWTASFDVKGFRLKPLTFKAPAGAAVNITSGLVPVSSTPYQLVQGEPGASAYQVAVTNGFVGTETEWLASLKGDPGTPVWDEVTGKPSTFPSTIPLVDGLQAALDEAGGTPAWDDVAGKPATYPPTAHTHAVADVAGLATRLTLLEYNTGWRDVSSLLGTQYISGEYWIKRAGSTVHLHFYELKLAWTSGTSVRPTWNLIAGLRPSTRYANLPFAGKSATTYAAGPLRISRYGVLDIYGFGDGRMIDADVSFDTEDAPLAAGSLPGVAVTIF